MLLCVCSVIDHRARQNVERTTVTHLAITLYTTFCLTTFDDICDLLLNRCTARWNLIVKLTGAMNVLHYNENWNWGSIYTFFHIYAILPLKQLSFQLKIIQRLLLLKKWLHLSKPHSFDKFSQSQLLFYLPATLEEAFYVASPKLKISMLSSECRLFPPDFNLWKSV